MTEIEKLLNHSYDYFRENSIYDIDLREIETSLNRAASKVTFWGTRVIEIDGASFSLKHLTDKINTIASECHADQITKAYKHPTYQGLSIEQRISGMVIANRLWQLYTQTEEEFKKTHNYIKIFLNFIWEFHTNPFNTWFFLEYDSTKSNFSFFKMKTSYPTLQDAIKQRDLESSLKNALINLVLSQENR